MKDVYKVGKLRPTNNLLSSSVLKHESPHKRNYLQGLNEQPLSTKSSVQLTGDKPLMLRLN